MVLRLQLSRLARLLPIQGPQQHVIFIVKVVSIFLAGALAQNRRSSINPKCFRGPKLGFICFFSPHILFILRWP